MIGSIAERSIVYGLLAALCFGAGWKVNGWRLGEGIARDQSESIRIVRVIERDMQDVADSEGNKGNEELEQARADADRAAATADGLRNEARSLATRLATCNAETAGERTARENAARVLADVLAAMESEGRAMAGIAQGSRAGGLACEAIYDGVSASMR